MMKLIGISGLARSGKDSFFELSKPLLKSKSFKFKRYAFADALKEECDSFLIKNTGISAFTENSKEKEIIRPLLVVYGTHIRRKMDKNCWISKIENRVKDSISSKEFVFITDVRFKNEIDWVHKLGGVSIHVSRENNTPPNKDELKNDPILKQSSLIKIEWENFSEANMYKMSNKVEKVLKSIIDKI